MGPGRILFLIFLMVPILEIYLLIKVGGVIGALPTIALVVLTAVIGSAMLRHQGLAVLRQAQQSMDQGTLPARALLDGVFLVIGGALLLTPGFFTDAVGFVCLVPAGRDWLVRIALQRLERMQRDGRVQVHTAGGRDDSRSGPTTLEGEYRREDE